MSNIVVKGGIYLGLILAVSLLGAGFLANSILPLYPITSSITVKSEATGLPIQGASVSAYIWGVLVGSGVTGTNGVAAVNVNQNIPIDFVVVASGYQTKTQTITFTQSPAVYSATIQLTPGGSTSYVRVRIYTVTSEIYKVRDVKITGGAVAAITNAESYADLLLTQGTASITLNGGSATMQRVAVWESLTFGTITKQITSSEGAVYTVYVPGGTMQSGAPDFPIDDLMAMAATWLLGNTMGVPNYLLVAVLLLLILRSG